MIIRSIFFICGLGLMIGALVGVKALQIEALIASGENFVPPPEAVTTAVAERDIWPLSIKAVGTVEAVNGVMVSAEVPGRITEISFTAGQTVAAGDVLLQQDTSIELAQLRANQATRKWLNLSLERSRSLLSKQTISQSEFDEQDARFQEADAQIQNIEAQIAKKTIRAPFAGRLGVRLVDLGQNLKDGNEVVSLQDLSEMFVNFQIPQRSLNKIKVGDIVVVGSDVLGEKELEGTIMMINPQIDASTRNIQVQARFSNDAGFLLPGMFVDVRVKLDEKDDVIIVPATAVLYAPYGDSLFIVEEDTSEQTTEGVKVVRQQFVRLGRTLGDFVEIVSGLKVGENVATTGVFKLRNGQAVVEKNHLSPAFAREPSPEDT